MGQMNELHPAGIYFLVRVNIVLEWFRFLVCGEFRVILSHIETHLHDFILLSFIYNDFYLKYPN